MNSIPSITPAVYDCIPIVSKKPAQNNIPTPTQTLRDVGGMVYLNENGQPIYTTI